MSQKRQTIRLADLRHRIVFEEKVLKSDKGGGQEVSWKPIKELWAKIEPLKTTPELEVMREGIRMTHCLTFRFQRTLASNMRIRFQKRIFKIKGLFNVGEQNKWHKAICEEETSLP